ncbi:MAG: monooxygenase FAD-binding protein [Acidobacteriaceae bacterium]|nr:monooxygenase FAD-binding protein [Acidobacteriaceae bacterium]
MKQPRIAVIGAGPGGLTLARILRLHGIEASVFEREASSSIRPQGGSLDMHADSGQFAIQCAGLTAEFKRIARYEDQEGRIYDKHGTQRFLDVDTSDKDRPEVDRGHLRQMLLDSLPPDAVRWNHELSAATRNDDGTWELAFQNGCSETFDLVVGADGAWSRIRPLVSQVRPVYSGVMFVELGIDDADRRYPELAQLVGRGMMFAVGDSKTLMGHRDADAHLGIYAAMRVPEDWVQAGGLDWSSAEAMKASLIGYFDGWSEELLQLIARSGGGGGRITPRAIYALPIGHRWEHRQGVTLIGDAAHLMSPFGGDGANLAMQDAADLALALVEEEDPDAAVQRFETAMFPRAEEAAQGAWHAIQDVFSEDGLNHMVQTMEEHRAAGNPSPSQA